MTKIHNYFRKRSKLYSQWHENPFHLTLHWIVFIMFSIFLAVNTYSVAYANFTDETVQYQLSALSVQNPISLSSESRLRIQTMKLVESLADNSVTISSTGSGDTNILSMAKKRKSSMLNALEKGNVESVIRTALPNEILAGIPESLKQDMEQRVSVSGHLQTVYLDVENIEKGGIRYSLLTGKDNERFTLYSPEHDLQGGTNDLVTVQGIKIDNNLIIEDDSILVEQNNLQTAAADDGSATVTKKVGVFLFNFQNNVVEPYSTDTIRQKIFTNSDSPKEFYKEMSQNKIDLTGDVTGWITIPTDNYYDCSRDYSALKNLAYTELSKRKISPSSYDVLVFNFYGITGPYCNNVKGLGELGFRGPLVAWIYNNNMYSSQITHEMGHNFNRHHAASLTCTKNGVKSTIGDYCYIASQTHEYGDPFDVMGNWWTKRHFHAYHLAQTGSNLLPAVVSSNNIITATSTASFTIAPVNAYSDQPQIIRIPKTYTYIYGGPITNSGYYYISYRQPTGIFDNFPATSPAVNGLSINLGPNINYRKFSLLLDATPQTNTFEDATLTVGKSFTDPDLGVTITAQSIGPENAVVNISFGDEASCEHSNPSIILNSANPQSEPGQSREFSVTVVNNNSENCGTTNYILTRSVPSGWSSSPDTETVSLLPGQSVNRTFIIYSSTSTTAGNYPVTFTVSEAEQPTYSAVVSGQYTIVTPISCEMANPSLAISPSFQEGNAGETNQFTLTLNNNDSEDCSLTTFALRADTPLGWIISPNTLSYNIGPGEEITETISVTPPASLPIGSYSFAWNAQNTANTIFQATASATLSLNQSPINCQFIQPYFEIYPRDQSGTPGESLNYNFKLRNNNIDCESVGFVVKPYLPNGLSASPAQFNETLASGEEVTRQFAITSPVSTTPGKITFNQSVLMNNNNTYWRAFNAYYTVLEDEPSPFCLIAQPYISVSPRVQAGVAGSTLTYTISLRNNNIGPCPDEKYLVNPYLPNGLKANPASFTITLPNTPGSNEAVREFTVTSPITANTGNIVFNQTAIGSGGYSKRGVSNSTYSIINAAGINIATNLTASYIDISSPSEGIILANGINDTLSIVTEAITNKKIKNINILVNGQHLSECKNATYCNASILHAKLKQGLNVIRAEAADEDNNKILRQIFIYR